MRIDDVPEVTDWPAALRGRFYRPRKKAISLRLDMDVLEWLKAQPGPYTTRINDPCRSRMLSHLIGADADRETLLETLLALCDGRRLILEALDQDAGTTEVAPRIYRFSLYTGKTLVFEGDSVDPAARAEVLAEGRLSFDRLVIDGRWRRDQPGRDVTGGGAGVPPKKTG